MASTTAARDVVRTARQLAGLLESTGMREVQIAMLPSPTGTGFSSETLLFDATATVHGERVTESCVARVLPADYTLYQDHDLDAQWRVIDALHRSTSVPVPRIVAHDAVDGTWLGQPCFVMERIEGRPAADVPPYTVAGWLKDGAVSDQRGAYERGLDVLARIHAVDWRLLGLDFLLDSTANPVGVDRQLAHDDRFLDWISINREFPLLHRAQAWLRAHRPADGLLALTWGDARLGNMLFRDFEPVAVLDWEMVTLSAPAADLAWWFVFDRIRSHGRTRTPLPGFPTEAEAVELYQSMSGTPIGDLRFYEVRAALRASMLLVRFTDALVADGTLAADAPRLPYTAAFAVLEQYLDD